MGLGIYRPKHFLGWNLAAEADLGQESPKDLPAEAPQAKFCTIWSQRDSFSFTKSHSVPVQSQFFQPAAGYMINEVKQWNYDASITSSESNLPVNTIRNRFASSERKLPVDTIHMDPRT